MGKPADLHTIRVGGYGMPFQGEYHLGDSLPGALPPSTMVEAFSLLVIDSTLRSIPLTSKCLTPVMHGVLKWNKTITFGR